MDDQRHTAEETSQTPIGETAEKPSFGDHLRPSLFVGIGGVANAVDDGVGSRNHTVKLAPPIVGLHGSGSQQTVVPHTETAHVAGVAQIVRTRHQGETLLVIVIVKDVARLVVNMGDGGFVVLRTGVGVLRAIKIERNFFQNLTLVARG